jgi:hypothetical protein
MTPQEGNDCQYTPPGYATGVVCWKEDKKKGKEKKGNWDCEKRYHWVEDNEKCANVFMPKSRIRWLIIAESPPCPTNHDEPSYIYRIVNQDEDRPILEAIIEAFKEASGETEDLTSKQKKLDYMANKKGAFLMDLCCYPLNNLKDRGKLRKNSEYEFYLDLLGLLDKYHRRIENIVIVGKGWHKYALKAIDIADLGNLVRNRNRENRIYFPRHDKYVEEGVTYYEKCVELLSKFFENPMREKTRIPQPK